MSYHVLHGKGWFGRIDQVPGEFRVGRASGVMYVATKFYHINGIPLVPIGTYAVISYPGITENLSLAFGMSSPVLEIRIPTSKRSIFLGYLRAFLIWAAALAIIALLGIPIAWWNNDLVVQLDWAQFVLFYSLLLFIVGTIYLMLWLSYRGNQATDIRSEELGKLFGYN